MSYTAAELTTYRDFRALVATKNEAALPIFERFEIELEAAHARESADPLEAARALLRLHQRRGAS